MVVHFQGLPVTYLTGARQELSAGSNPTIPQLSHTITDF